MHSADVLSQLRSLNWLSQEIRRIPADSRELALLEAQRAAVRARLPFAILDHHDQLARDAQTSLAALEHDRCGACRANLEPDVLATLRDPGRFAVCPQCRRFLWSGEALVRTDSQLQSGSR